MAWHGGAQQATHQDSDRPKHRTIIVADSGPGIDAVILPYLFQPGYSLRVPPSGLGLYICKYYMQSMKGNAYGTLERERIEGLAGRNLRLILARSLPNGLSGRKNKQMRYSVCIIDNDLPASGQEAQALGITDIGLLNASNLQLLIHRETWEDHVIKNLTETLLGQKEADGISSEMGRLWIHPSFLLHQRH